MYHVQYETMNAQLCCTHTLKRYIVLTEPCYYNIQTIKYHNNAELIFLQHISRRCQPRLWNFEKHKNLHFSKSKKHKIQGTCVHTKQRNGGTKNKHCNLLIYTVPLNRVLIEPCYYNIQTIKWHNVAELVLLQFYCVQLQFNNCVELDIVIIVKKVQKNSWKRANQQYSYQWHQQHANIV